MVFVSFISFVSVAVFKQITIFLENTSQFHTAL